MKVLVTGASGFIGSRLCELLNDKKIDVVRFSSDLNRPETYSKDNFDIIIHLAAKITHHDNFGDDEVRKTNVLGTKNLLDFYPDAKFIYISTTDVARPSLSFYAKTKLEAEEIISQNKNNLIIRLPSVFGPRQVQDKLIPRLIRRYYLGQECNVTNDDLREYIFINEVCNAIIENFGNSGLVTLKGIKIRNFRLNELIKNIHAGERLKDLSVEESKLWQQLKICCEEFSKIEK